MNPLNPLGINWELVQPQRIDQSGLGPGGMPKSLNPRTMRITDLYAMAMAQEQQQRGLEQGPRNAHQAAPSGQMAASRVGASPMGQQAELQARGGVQAQPYQGSAVPEVLAGDKLQKLFSTLLFVLTKAGNQPGTLERVQGILRPLLAGGSLGLAATGVGAPLGVALGVGALGAAGAAGGDR